jgi:hypothetical protein
MLGIGRLHAWLEQRKVCLAQRLVFASGSIDKITVRSITDLISDKEESSNVRNQTKPASELRPGQLGFWVG